MGPRLRVDQATFLTEVAKSQGKVIRSSWNFFHGYIYLVKGEDYYYYTTSRKELQMPEGVEITNVAQILL